MKKSIDTKKFLQSKIFPLAVLFVLIIIIFTIWAPLRSKTFFSVPTLATILNSMTVAGFLAVGASFLMITGNIDLSAASVGAFGGVFCAAAIIYWHIAWPLAAILSIAVCAFFGLFNAFLINEFGFQPFIATMAMSSVIKGAMTLVSVKDGAAQTILLPDNAAYRFLLQIGQGKINISSTISIPYNVFLLIAAFIIFGIILSKTKFGMKMYLVGGNPFAARLVGVNPKKISYILFANSAAMGGIAGLINAAKSNQGSIVALQTDMFTGLTAAMLGGISFGGGSGGMGGAFLGLMITRTFAQGMNTVNANVYWTTVFSGILLLVALTLDYFNQRLRIKGAM
jgi:ribose/xylose/arabinose/galactoside ABC-type transport system permease subunit